MKQWKLATTQERLISIISFIYLCVLLFYIFMDGIGKQGSSGVSGFIEQDNLRKSLGDWYQLVFWTFQVNLYFTIVGTCYAFFCKNQIVKNLFFCATSFLLFCLFAMSVFSFTSFKTNSYEASKTLFVHFIIPTSALIMLFFERNKILLSWKILFWNSLYVTFYIVLSIIIYYTHEFSLDSQYPGKPLWIYGFLDYDRQIMFVPLPTQALTIFGIFITLILSSPIGMITFLFIKFVFNIKIKPLNLIDTKEFNLNNY